MKEEQGSVDVETPVPPNMTIYRTGGVYQRLHLCDYLRELPEDPTVEAEERDRER